MADETLNLLRKMMIDQALENGDRDQFRNLTGPNWKRFVVDTESEKVDAEDPLAFLSEDPHFWDVRVYEPIAHRPYLNYRFRDSIEGFLYVGEIRIPYGRQDKIDAKFRPRPSSGPSVPTPDWFQSLLENVMNVTNLRLANSLDPL